MNPNDLAMIKSGVILLLAGMGMTFIFLYVQIICTNISSKVTGKFANLIPEPEVKKPAKKAAPAPQQQDDAIVAAIAAAIHHANNN